MSEQQTEQQVPPSKEDIVKFLSEQIEVKKVQYELQELNTKLAVARAEELKALSFIAQMTNPSSQGKPHTITDEDIQNNPELAEQGFKVGDEVMVEETPAKKERGLKKK